MNGGVLQYPKLEQFDDINMYPLHVHTAHVTKRSQVANKEMLTWVLKTSINCPEECRIRALATPFPTYQSPLQKAVGRPFKGYLHIVVLSRGHLLRIANPPPRTPEK
jgi:hypothetical protein